jgi:hypothetical protein
MRMFHLVRGTDISGVSGVGLVAEGVEFTDGRVALRWCAPNGKPSTVVWDSIADAMSVHGHDGATVVVWLADEVTEGHLDRRLGRRQTPPPANQFEQTVAKAFAAAEAAAEAARVGKPDAAAAAFAREYRTQVLENSKNLRNGDRMNFETGENL